MKNMINKALCALMTLAIIAPAYGMSRLTQGFNGYHVRKAVNGTLAARLFNRTQKSQGFKSAELRVQTSPAQAKPGFFSKWLASVPLIGWMWQSDEDQLTQTILKQPGIKNSLVTTDWNPNHHIIGKYVFEKCRKKQLNATECGVLYKNVQEKLEQTRSKELSILDTKNRNKQIAQKEQLQKMINTTATEIAHIAMQGQLQENGSAITVAQATDAQLASIVSGAQKNFSKCNHKETYEYICKPASDIVFQQLKLFRDAAQGKTTPVKTPKN